MVSIEEFHLSKLQSEIVANTTVRVESNQRSVIYKIKPYNDRLHGS